MKSEIRFTLLTAALLLCGCSEAPAKTSSASQSSDTQTPASETEAGSDSASESENSAVNESTAEKQTSESTESNQNSSSSGSLKSLTVYGDEFRNAFKEAGFEIYDVEEETDEYSFEASSNQGRCDISLERYPSADTALLHYKEEIHDEEDDGLISLSSREEGLLSLTVMNGTAGSTVSYVGFNKEGQFVFEIDDIQLTAEDAISPILKELGYPVSEE